MKGVLTINTIRYLNIFEKITKIRAKNCFFYNGFIYFLVPKKFIYTAIGKNSENLKKISKMINKKIKVIIYPTNNEEIIEFINKLADPLQLKNVEIKEGKIIIDSGSRETKALLIGRNKRKLEELRKISKEFFGYDINIL